MKETYLTFPLITGENIYLRASEFSRDVFSQLREIMKLPATPGDICVGNIRPMEEAPEGCWYPKSQLFRMKPYRSGEEMTIYIPEETPPTENMTMAQGNAFIARRTLFFLLLRQILEGKLSVMHGGMNLTPTGKALIFSGPSGVGKSTAVIKAGKKWQILADDCLFITRHDGKYYAQPGATWSTYFSEKKRLVDCDATHIREIGEIVMLSRLPEEPRVEKIDQHHATLSLAGSLISNLQFQAEVLPDKTLRDRIRCNAFDTVTDIVQKIPIFRLYSQLETDIIPLIEPHLR